MIINYRCATLLLHCFFQMHYVHTYQYQDVQYIIFFLKHFMDILSITSINHEQQLTTQVNP